MIASSSYIVSGTYHTYN